jgi:hypothetical protein
MPRTLEEKDQALIFRLAAAYQDLYGAPGTTTHEFFAAIENAFISATGWAYTGIREQLFRQEKQWRGIMKSRRSRPGTWNHTELSLAARQWIKIMDQKAEGPELAEAQHRALAEDDDWPYSDLTNDENAPPNEPVSMPQTKSSQKWPPTRLASTSRAPRTPSESPSRGRKKRRRCSSPRSERSIELSNEHRRSSTPRRGTVSMSLLQEFIDGVNERLAAREARLDAYEESLTRREDAMDRQFNQVMELLKSNLVGRPGPTAPTTQAAPTQVAPVQAAPTLES